MRVLMGEAPKGVSKGTKLPKGKGFMPSTKGQSEFLKLRSRRKLCEQKQTVYPENWRMGVNLGWYVYLLILSHTEVCISGSPRNIAGWEWSLRGLLGASRGKELSGCTGKHHVGSLASPHAWEFSSPSSMWEQREDVHPWTEKLVFTRYGVCWLFGLGTSQGQELWEL